MQSLPRVNPRILPLGSRFGRWTVSGPRTVLARHGRRFGAHPCRCDCGAESIILTSQLLAGRSRSCGCLIVERVVTHAHSHERLYGIWKAMHNRCTDPRNPWYHNYGGRGIRVCPEWSDFMAFRAWALASGYTDELTIERRDANGNYEPANCSWATRAEQSRNKRTSRFFTGFGETKCVEDWLRDPRCQVTKPSLYYRMAHGMSFEEALTLPVRPQGRRGK